MDFSLEMVSSLALVMAIGLSVGYVATTDSGQTTATDRAGVDWHNEITIKHNGEEVARFHNTLTDQGKNWIRSQIANVGAGDQIGADSDNATYISLGNGSDVVAGDVVLDSEIQAGGLSRSAGSVTTFGPGEFQVQNTFTASSDVGVVNTTGLNYGSSPGSNTLISGGAFAAEANILNGDSLTVTHNITISQN